MDAHDVPEAMGRRDVLRHSLLMLFLGHSLAAVASRRLLPIRWERHRGDFSSDFSPSGFDVEGWDCIIGASDRAPRLRFWSAPPFVGIVRSK